MQADRATLPGMIRFIVGSAAPKMCFVAINAAWACFVSVIVVVVALSAPVVSGQKPAESLRLDNNPQIAELSAWLTDAGAYLDNVGVGNGELGHRGVIAAVPIEEGDVILRIPLNKAINTGPISVTASEAAVKLLREVHKKRSTRLPYVNAMPPLGECDAIDTWPEEDLGDLPKAVVNAATARRRFTTKVYQESVHGKVKLFGGHDVTFEEFKHGVYSPVQLFVAFEILALTAILLWHKSGLPRIVQNTRRP